MSVTFKHHYLENRSAFQPPGSSPAKLWQYFAALAVLSPFPSQILRKGYPHCLVEISDPDGQFVTMQDLMVSYYISESLQTKQWRVIINPHSIIINKF